IADRPDSADGIECQEPAKELPPPKLHVTIGKRVIDDEVERHRDEDCQGLRIAETLSAHIERKTQYEQMHQQTDAAHRRDHKETNRQKMADHLFEQKNDEFLPHFRVQLDLACTASVIGRASCRERECQYVSIPVVAGSLKKKKE